jgi:hypothetical protein
MCDIFWFWEASSVSSYGLGHSSVVEDSDLKRRSGQAVPDLHSTPNLATLRRPMRRELHFLNLKSAEWFFFDVWHPVLCRRYEQVHWMSYSTQLSLLDCRIRRRNWATCYMKDQRLIVWFYAVFLIVWKLKQPECDVIYVETCRLNVRVMFSNKDSCVEIDTEFTCLSEWFLYRECWVIRKIPLFRKMAADLVRFLFVLWA